MKRLILFFVVVSLVISLVAYKGCTLHKGPITMMIPKINSQDDIKQLFPTTPEALKKRTAEYIEHATAALNSIIAIPQEHKTFANTIEAYDHLSAALGSFAACLQSLEMVHPQENMRTAAHDLLLEFQNFLIETFATNKELYHAIKEYEQHAFLTEKLSEEERYFVTEVVKGFKRSGLELPDDKLAILKELQKELAALSLQFETNINSETRTLAVSEKDLAGVPATFIESLKKDNDGNLLLPLDYPTQDQVMKRCTVEKTRENFWRLFSNRAYPINEEILTRIITLRDELAKLLGYASYAEFDIDDTMAHKAGTVEAFLKDVETRAQRKALQEIEAFKQHLPAGITLTDDGKIKPWDMEFIKNVYKERFFDIDEAKIAAYFPMERTIQGLLSIYQDFFDVTFSTVNSKGWWHEEVQFVEVRRKDGTLIGYLLLDLHPRDFKYTHACQIGLVSTVTLPSGEYYPAVALVIANFPKPTATTPSLLMRNDVITFFHEFGHALHSLFGSTRMINFAGTSVKTDFVEMPSQMFEEWMWNEDMIKKVSSHYQTGEPLSSEVINKIRSLKNYDSGDTVLRQLLFGNFSLSVFKEGAHKDIQAIKNSLFERIRPYIMNVPEAHFEASFGHLTNYGAKYYGYLWSKVYALDLFDTIKQGGLLNPVIGTLFRVQVLGKGGSKEPMELLRDFLGREPKSDAFFKDLGL